MKNVKAIFAGMTLAVAVALPAAAQEDPIVIGVASGQTGVLGPWDLAGRRGAELAIEDINAKGGVLGRPLSIVVSDTKSDPSLGPTAAAEVLDQGAEMVIVACDYDFAAPAAMATVAANKIVFSTCAADPKFGVQGIGPLAYTMSLASTAQGTMLAEWAYETQGWRSAYVMMDTAIEYTKSLCQGFRDRWTELAGAEAISGEDTWNGLNDTTIAGQISRMKPAMEKSDFVMWCGFTNHGSVLRQVRSAGIDTPIVGSEAMDGAYWANAVPDLNDFYVAVYASIYGNDPDERVNEFMARYEKNFGEQAPMGHAVTGYAAVEAWARAAEKAGSLEVEQIQAALDSFNGEPLLVGPSTFRPDLHIDLTRPLLIMRAVNGKYEPIGRFAAQKPAEPTF
ncbi:MAG TPA: ABC transporter substrate-binding protein [Geminicoccus sp.]|uniref:ABC transporter substrate-binding protein n=1 Tax=Geminicoccus sp. TaxID=2024832 RepID=UPI002C4D6F57|nr:ABC transporter substrate-binding protein [Geminicoccus sp.]HWL71764.1 ABC transporter substrate-binding protein [Geminicoccus sp.]